MNEITQVTEYVDRVFRQYDADRLDFFECLADDFSLKTEEIPLFPSTEIDEETLERVSIYLGLTKQEILDRDETAARKYWDKYSFFQLFQEYNKQWWWNARFKEEMPPLKERLLRAIFSDEDVIYDERYDYKSVQIRLIEKLREINAVMPGTFHEGAEITHLRISTEVFFSFPKCSEMLRSYFEMVNRAEELFFKAIQTELPEEEACELNFLASQLKAKDALTSDTLVTYENVRLLRKIYIEENLSSFLSYVKISGFEKSSPWRCQEFFDDIDLVQQFVNIFPRAKVQMREFAMEVKKFACSFVWSDANPIMFSPEEEAIDKLTDDYVPIEKRAKEPTFIYVDKTSNEMFGWESSAERLNRAASPASMGGLELPPKEMTFPVAGPETLPRMKRRIAAKHGGGK